jgi:hypothetical protein
MSKPIPLSTPTNDPSDLCVIPHPQVSWERPAYSCHIPWAGAHHPVHSSCVLNHRVFLSIVSLVDSLLPPFIPWNELSYLCQDISSFGSLLWWSSFFMTQPKYVPGHFMKQSKSAHFKICLSPRLSMLPTWFPIIIMSLSLDSFTCLGEVCPTRSAQDSNQNIVMYEIRPSHFIHSTQPNSSSPNYYLHAL